MLRRNRLNSHTNTLFHYTKSEDILLSILKEGLRFVYCKERLDERLCFGIPMISFCDIPVAQSVEHTSKYGEFAIGLSKEYLISNYSFAIGPVTYYLKGAPIFKMALDYLRIYGSNVYNRGNVLTVSNSPGDKTILSKEEAPGVLKSFFDTNNYHQLVTTSIGIIKPYCSEYEKGVQINYDECEWRMIVPENARLSATERCKWFWTEQEFDDWREKYGDIFINSWSLPFDISDINFLIVPDNESVKSLIQAIYDMETLCGQPIDDEEKALLCTKILSFDQIRDI